MNVDLVRLAHRPWKGLCVFYDGDDIRVRVTVGSMKVLEGIGDALDNRFIGHREG